MKRYDTNGRVLVGRAAFWMYGPVFLALAILGGIASYWNPTNEEWVLVNTGIKIDPNPNLMKIFGSLAGMVFLSLFVELMWRRLRDAFGTPWLPVLFLVGGLIAILAISDEDARYYAFLAIITVFFASLLFVRRLSGDTFDTPEEAKKAGELQAMQRKAARGFHLRTVPPSAERRTVAPDSDLPEY